jgi:Mrp family chromosome partitioning ATPase
MLQMHPRNGDSSAFAITSPSAGDGKTTLTVALGMSFAAAGNKTLLMDLDLVGGGLTARINRPQHRKLGKLLVREGRITERQLELAVHAAQCSGRQLGEVLVEMGAITSDQLERALLSQLKTSIGLSDMLAGEPLARCIIPSGMPNLWVLPLGTAGREQVSQLSSDLIQRILGEAQKHFATVLIDTGPILGSLEAAMIAGADAGVILTISRGGDKTLARRAAEFLAKTGSRVEGIVFNRAETQDLETSGYSSYSSRISRSLQRSTSRHQINNPNIGVSNGSDAANESSSGSK